MKEKSKENNAKVYNKVIERARKVLLDCTPEEQHVVEYIFPQLKDENIRREILLFLREGKPYHCPGSVKRQEWLSWLEKQGKKESDPRYEELEEILVADDIYQMAMNDAMVKEAKTKAVNAISKLAIGKLLGIEKQNEQKPADKVEPKFHEGEWVILTAGEFSTTLQIVKVDTDKRLYWFNDNSHLPIVDEECLRHWTIQDAKDGDVLACESGGTEFIVILKDISKNGNINSYCRYNTCCGFGIDIPNVMSISNNPEPATKEQRDALFAKMKEAGYEWDADKKELKELREE